MKLPLAQVFTIAHSMRRIQGCGLSLPAAEQIRWAISYKRVWEIAGPVDDTVRVEFEKGARTPEAYAACLGQTLEAVNGEQVDVQLPAPIPLASVLDLKCKTPAEWDSLVFLIGTILVEPERTE